MKKILKVLGIAIIILFLLTQKVQASEADSVGDIQPFFTITNPFQNI